MIRPGLRRLVRIAIEGTVVDALGFEEHHRVVVLDRGDQQALGIVGIRRDHGLQAAYVGEYAFRRLRMRLPATDSAAAGRAHHHRRPELAAAAITQSRQFADDLVRRRVDVIGKLDFRDRTQPVDAHADRGGDDAALGDRRIEHAMPAVFFLQPGGAAKHAAEITHVLAEHQHVFIAPHAQIECGIDRLDHVHARHLSRPPSCGGAACADAAASP